MLQSQNNMAWSPLKKYFFAIAATSTVFALLVGCQYEGPLSGVSCEADDECPYSAPCVEGWCDLGPPSEQPQLDASTGDVSSGNDVSTGDAEDASADDVAVGDAGCSGGQLLCEGQCVDLMSSVDHCGECQNPCVSDAPNTVGQCLGGECEFGCAPGAQLCGDLCVDTENDDENCGACGRSCRSGTCSGGECEFGCSAGQTPFGGGTGTEDDPYVICSAEHLSNIGSDDFAHLNSSFVLNTDIDLAGFAMTEFPIIGYYIDDDNNEPFQGYFDGYGRAIQNLAMDAYQPGVGGESNGSTLFGYIGPQGRVENIRLLDVQMNGLNFISGLVGLNSGELRNCEVTGRVEGDGHVIGGIATDNRGLITDCTADVLVSGVEMVGGAIGVNRSTLTRIDVQGDVLGSYRRVGGLAGQNHGSISNSQARGEVTAVEEVGGLVGQNLDGGIISRSRADVMVTATGESSGGLVGLNEATIHQCSAIGEVEGAGRVGGLVGQNDHVITESRATNSVLSSGNRLGGLVGYNRGDGMISDSYATGATGGPDEVGGLVGRNRGGINRSYSFGSATAIGSDVGGLVGDTGGDVYSSFWNSEANSELESSDDHNSDDGKSLMPLEFGDAANFVGWSFDDIWEISVQHARSLLQWEDTD